jgi:hypothetical protein
MYLYLSEDLWPTAHAPSHLVDLYDAYRGSMGMLEDVLRYKDNAHSHAAR